MTNSLRTSRRDEILRRAGKDPVLLDTRPSSEVLNDEIPYARWEKELNVVHRAGFKNWIELLTHRKNNAKT